MGTQAAALSSLSLSPSSSYAFLSSSSSQSVSFKPSLQPLKHANSFKERTRANLDEKDKNSMLIKEQEPNQEVECVKVLKNAAKSRKVPAEDILSAFSVIEKAKIDPSGCLETLGGSESPGRTWMLIFTAKEQLKGGRYFPLTAVQRFDAASGTFQYGEKSQYRYGFVNFCAAVFLFLWCVLILETNGSLLETVRQGGLRMEYLLDQSVSLLLKEDFHGRTEFCPSFSNESGLRSDLLTL